jgi:hypothetical protein
MSEPPAHPNCRCWITPVVEGAEERETGLGQFGLGPVVSKPIVQPVVIPAFKNTKEAARWLVDNKYAQEADFGKADLSSANSVIASIVDHSQQFPETTRGINFIGSAQAGNKNLLARVTEMARADAINEGLTGDQIEKYINITKKRYKPYTQIPQNAYAYVEQRVLPGAGGLEKNVVINETYFSNSAAFAQKLKDNVAIGWHPEGVDTIKSVIDHEMGHLVTDSLRDAATSEEFINIYKLADNMPGGIAGNVSTYATTNAGEFFAEAWAEYKNNPSPRPIARMVGELLMKLGSRK